MRERRIEIQSAKANDTENADPITEMQRRCLFRLAAGRGIEADKINDCLKNRFKVRSLRQVSKTAADKMIEALLKGRRGLSACNSQADQMDHLSSSRIRLYLQCGLKYCYQYVENRPKSFIPAALAFGGALHSAIAWLNQNRMKGGHLSLDCLCRVFEADWCAQKLETEIRCKPGEDKMTLMALAREMLNLYINLPAPEVMGYEVPFIVPLVHPTAGEGLDVNLEGYFDLVQADGVIVEFKTSTGVMNQDEVDALLQLTAYGYAYERLFRKPATGIKVVNFVKNKRPKIVEFTTNRSRKDYESFFDLAKEVLKGIRSEVFFPRPGWWCKQCEYANFCPLMKPDDGQA